MINLTDKLTAKTVENILGESKEIAYIYGDTNTRTENTVANNLNELNDEIVKKANIGEIVGNPTKDWVQGTVEQYIDDKINEQNAEINRKLAAQQLKLNTLNGNDCKVVDSLPQPGSVGVVYRVPNDPDDSHYSDYMWDINASTPEFKKLATYSYPGVDEKPKHGSRNFVESGGVFDEIVLNSGAFDLTAYNSGTTYSALSDALAAMNINELSSYRKGGMSIRYVQSSDNNYVQYRLMATDFSTTESDWQGIDIEPIYQSKNLVDSGGIQQTVADIFTSISKEVTDYRTEKYPILSNGTYGIDDSYSHAVIPVLKGDRYVIRNGHETINTLRFAFSVSDAIPGSGDDRTIPVVSGTSVTTVSHQTSVVVEAPDDCFLLCNAGERYVSIIYKVRKDLQDINILNELPIAYNENSCVGVELLKEILLGSDVLEKKCIDLAPSNISLRAASILTTGLYGNDTYFHAIIPVSEGDIVEVTANSTNKSTIAFLGDLSWPIRGRSIPVVSGSSITRINASETVLMKAPAGTVCVAIQFGKEDTQYPAAPSIVNVYSAKNSVDENLGRAVTMDFYYMPTTDKLVRNTTYVGYCVKVKSGDSFIVNCIKNEGESGDIYMKFAPSIPIDGLSLVRPEAYKTSQDVHTRITCNSNGYYCFVSTAHFSINVSNYTQKESAEETEIKKGLNYREVDFTSAVIRDYYINDYGNYGTNADNKHAIIPVNELSGFVKVTASQNPARLFWLASDNEPVSGGTPDYCSSVPGVIKLNGGETEVFNIPSDANFLAVYMSTAPNYSSKPAFVETISDIDHEKAELVKYLVFDEVELSNLTKYDYWIDTSSNKYGSSKTYKHILVNVSNAKFVKISSSQEVSSQYAWFTEMDTPSSGGTPPLVDNTVHMLEPGQTIIEEVPDGAKMMYIYLSSQDNFQRFMPSYVGIYTGTDDKDEFDNDFNARRDRQVTDLTAISLTQLIIPTDENGWELPTTLQQLNTQKKAEQLVNIRWTPKWNVPSKGASDGIYPAGVEYDNGIPYSSNNDDGSKTVGEEVSLHTFMTAIDNPYSLIYTECVNNGQKWPDSSKPNVPTQKSAWGKTYTQSSNGFAYYGTVCCGLTSSVTNSPIKWNNPVMNNYKKTNGVYVPVCQPGKVDFNLLKIGDVCDNNSHSFIVYGLHRDSNGNVDKVKISESSTNISKGGCRIYEHASRSAFEERINKTGNPFTVLRYVNLWDNTDYEPSEYVPLVGRGESATTVTYNNAICTFAGDKATFRNGDLVVINYNLYGEQLHTWTKIMVYKDDVLLNEYTLSEAEQTLTDFYNNDGDPITPDPFNAEINQANHALVLGKNLSAGMYKACMSDEYDNYSDYTYWEVIDADISVLGRNQDSYVVTVGGTNEIQVVYVNGMYYLPTYEEKVSRRFIIHPISLAQTWDYTYDTFGVMFKLKGAYGNATTFPVSMSGAFIPEEEGSDPEE